MPAAAGAPECASVVNSLQLHEVQVCLVKGIPDAAEPLARLVSQIEAGVIAQTAVRVPAPHVPKGHRSGLC